MHRDLKPENILLTSKDPRVAQVKVADFGLAKICSSDVMSTICGTWAYCAPEVRTNPDGYTNKVDIWSLGVITFVLLVAYHPFDPYGQGDDAMLWKNICNGNFNFDHPSWKGISTIAQDFICKMITIDPELRLDAESVLAHPWLANSNHNVDPISECINSDLDTTKRKYAAAQKFKSATKAISAMNAFSSPNKPIATMNAFNTKSKIEENMTKI